MLDVYETFVREHSILVHRREVESERFPAPANALHRSDGAGIERPSRPALRISSAEFFALDRHSIPDPTETEFG